MLGASNARVQLFARLLVGLTSGGIVLCTVGFAVGAEHFGPLGQAQYLPFAVFLIPAAAAVFFSLVLGTAWRVAAITGVALVATAVMGFEFHVGEPGIERVRVMTFNVKGYLARDRPAAFARIAQEIALHKADILVLQDANELAQLEAKSPGATRAIFGMQQVFSHGEYAIASRFPLRECKPYQSSTVERADSYVHCIVEARGVEVDVINAHLMSPRPALNAARENRFQAGNEWAMNLASRMTHAEALAAHLRARRRPAILAGDLNVPESSVVMRTLLKAGLRDAFSTAGKGYGYTWGHSLPPGISFLRLDHILVSPEFAVVDCFVGSKLASQHRPVIADLYLHRRPG